MSQSGSAPSSREDEAGPAHATAALTLAKRAVSLQPEKEKAYQAALQQALQAGYHILSKGGSALDAVEAAVRVMEDSPLFNAGKGAVFTNEGKNELDAAIMDGQTLKAGAVAGLTIVKNPISAARSGSARNRSAPPMP